MDTEKATDRFDLPHNVDRVSQGDKMCICGRDEAHQLHQPSAREVASHDTSVLPRELGS